MRQGKRLGADSARQRDCGSLLGCGVAALLWLGTWACSGPAQAADQPSPPTLATVDVESQEPEAVVADRPAHAAKPRPAAWAQPLSLPGLPNLHRVTPTLYRSAQPLESGWSSVESLGIRSVLSLRAFHADDLPDGSRLRASRISFKSWHPEDEDVVRFLRFVQEPSNQPVLVHCQHGADRTGMMVAIERVALEGWSREAAIREMVDGGYGFHPVWENMIDYVREVDIERLQRLAGGAR